MKETKPPVPVLHRLLRRTKLTPNCFSTKSCSLGICFHMWPMTCTFLLCDWTVRLVSFSFLCALVSNGFFLCFFFFFCGKMKSVIARILVWSTEGGLAVGDCIHFRPVVFCLWMQMCDTSCSHFWSLKRKRLRHGKSDRLCLGVWDALQ